MALDFSTRTIGSIPYGQGPRDLDAARELALLRQLRAQLAKEEADAQKAAEEARLTNPLEAAKEAARVQQFRQRRDVREVLPERIAAATTATPFRMPRQLSQGNAPTIGAALEQGLRTIRRAAPPPAAPGPRQIRRFETAPTMTEQRMEAEAITDPNYGAAYWGREAEARLHPSVMAAEAYAKRPTTANQAAEDAEQYIATMLPRLGILAKEINQAGGPSGVVMGAIRRTILGPSQLDEKAREFNGIHGALALNLAAKFNRGRPTEPDREAAAAILPQLGDSPQLVERRMQDILSALGNPNLETLTDPVTGRQVRIRSGGGGQELGATQPSAVPGDQEFNWVNGRVVPRR